MRNGSSITSLLLGIIFLLTLSPTTGFAQSTTVEGLVGAGRRAVAAKPEFQVPEGVTLADGVTENEAVALALWNNPQLHADLTALGLARADLKDAGLLRNPLLTLLLPTGPLPQLESAIQFPVDVFWQRRKRVAAAKVEVERVAVSLEQNALNLVRDVRIAFTDLELARQRARMAEETVRLRKEVVRLMKIRLREGDVGEVEVTAAELDESLAVEQSVRFEREMVILLNRLRHIIGMIEQPEVDFVETPPASPVANDPSLEELTKAAFAARPDVRAAEFAIDGAAKRAKWERSRIGSLAALLNLRNTAGVGFAPRPGFAAEVPIFNRNQGGIGRADAEVERAAWLYVTTRQRVALDVSDAFNQRRQARETLAVWRQGTLPLARENRRLAEKAFSSGDQSFLVVLEADRRLVEVNLREAELRADLRRAEIQLDRAVGRTVNVTP
jgi:cobalt-zinc-cadmium efflux system outer membrane protein